MLAGLDDGPHSIGGGVNGGVNRALSAGMCFLATDFPKLSRIRCLRVQGIARFAMSALFPSRSRSDLQLRDGNI